MLELALLQEGHEPLESDDAEDEGNNHAHQKFRREVACVNAFQSLFRIEERFFRSHVLALDPLDAVEECCTANCGNAHEEAEFACVLAVHAHEHHGADGRTATADARDASDALNDASHESAPPVHLDTFVFRMFGAGRSPLRCEKQKAGEKFCNADGARIHEQRFKSVFKAKAYHGRRDAREHDEACFTELFLVTAEATDDNVYNLFAEHDEYGKERSGVEHDVEEHARFVHVQKFVPDYEVTGTRDREKFGEALQKAEDDGFKHSKVNVVKEWLVNSGW